jgi:transposase
MRKKRTEAGWEDYDKLRAEAERLRKELREQKMRAKVLDTMIDVAEEMFDIPIRRKADDKR